MHVIQRLFRESRSTLILETNHHETASDLSITNFLLIHELPFEAETID